jgi:hypothetical protein
MTGTIDTLLLLALPASGKSELRRYLAHLDSRVAEEDLHLGPTVQLDDYPYVHMMRRVSQELALMGKDPVFFADEASSFTEPRDWGTLMQMLKEDYGLLGATIVRPESTALWLFERLDRARRAVGAVPELGLLDDKTKDRLAAALEDEVLELWADRAGTLESWADGDTVVIEFARGGPDGAALPLTPPRGYSYSLGQLSDEILARSSILYVWVTPEESRRRNNERARPGRQGDASILHHGVPQAVMLGDYGSDDLPWLIERGGGEVVWIERERTTTGVPVAVFDNRSDRTSFLREDPEYWPPEAISTLHSELRAAFDRLVR